MKALRLHGRADVRLDDIPAPRPQPGQVAVRMVYVTLNHLDVYSHRGMLFAKREFPLIVAGEGAGHVAALGEGVTSAQVGAPVVAYPGLVCHACAPCRAGRENECLEPGGIMGFHQNGVAAQTICVPAANVVPVPPGLDLRWAACAPVTFATVEHVLVDQAGLRAGETILVHAGASGVGSAAISLARSLGARVITTVGSDDKAAAISRLAPDCIINYREKRFDREIRKMTGKNGVDVVFDHIGPDTWEGSLMSLRRGGRLVTCGSTSGVVARINLFMLFNKQVRIQGSFGSRIGNISTALDRLAAKTVQPLIAEEMEMRLWKDGVEMLEQRRVAGKILVKVAA